MHFHLRFQLNYLCPPFITICMANTKFIAILCTEILIFPNLVLRFKQEFSFANGLHEKSEAAFDNQNRIGASDIHGI